MPPASFCRSLWVLLRTLLPKSSRGQVRRLLAFWLSLRRMFSRVIGRGSGSSRDGLSRGRSPDDGKGIPGAITSATICPSRVPTSALPITSLGFLEVEPSLPNPQSFKEFRRAYNINPSPAEHEHTILQPYAHSLRNASQSSHDIGRISVSDYGSDAHRHVQHELRASRSPSRASSRREISRVASPATVRSARSRARSRSRTRRSQSSTRPPVLEPAPQPSAVSTLSTPPNVAVPNASSAVPPHETLLVRAPTPPRKIHPITAVQRYDKNVVIPKDPSKYTIEAMTVDFPLEGTPPDWKPCTHPEGALYWFHPTRRAYTDAYLCDQSIYDEIMEFLDLVDDYTHEMQVQLPTDHELVLELEPREGGGHNWCYYLADHTRRTLFWLQDFDVSEDLEELKGVSSAAHVKHEISSKYWSHWEMFPYNHKIPDDVIPELTGTIVHGEIDRMTSPVSTITYSPDELHQMLSLVKSVTDLGDTDHTACVVGRLMCVFYHHKFLNFHGQNGARLCRDQTIHGQKSFPRSPLIDLLAPLCFGAPNVHLRGLAKIWIDDLMVYHQWNTFIDKLKNEWQDFLLPATVLLNANVAFLAIPSVDPGSDQDKPRSAAQIMSYISMIFSVGSIILSMLLTRQHRLRARETADDVVRFLTRKTHPTLGLETLAVMYSLPYAMLMWATGPLPFSLHFPSNASSSMTMSPPSPPLLRGSLSSP
ncbi:hypothetical protein OBBRIDRAFT_172478 [Obba rivulosa]|uniref:Uncharacterized protein n=1 Tax=Obba rivulosa TaxID=1052685 RepID=A0A8E2DHQ6_9APHY|nr:hypothetical protein OBBRIDRAFT_172478 [Obba rivulosa]